MQEDKIYEAEEFELSLKAYLSYVSRKIKKDENYSPHPLVRALVNAVDGATDAGKPGRYIGVSGDANQYSDGEARKVFACIIEMNRDNTMTILEVEDISLQKPIPIKVASYILLLSIKFDKYEGDSIKVEDYVDIVNESIPQLNIIRFDNNEWKEARDYLAENIDTLRIPYDMSEDYERDFLSIKESTPWEEFPQRVRSTVALIWMQYKYPELFKDGSVNSVNVFLDEEYPKTKMLNNTLILLYGPSSEYFHDALKWSLFSDLNVIESTSKISTKIARNKPCPCGSGKKYKKCCGK